MSTPSLFAAEMLVHSTAVAGFVESINEMPDVAVATAVDL